jgi:hypothetical protein
MVPLPWVCSGVERVFVDVGQHYGGARLGEGCAVARPMPELPPVT